MTAFGLIEVTANGCTLAGTRRVPTNRLHQLKDTMRFINDCTDDLRIPDILSDTSDHKVSISIAEPVVRGQVAFNRKARVSRILWELQNGPLLALGETCPSRTERVGRCFVINDSCATGVYAARALASYCNGLVSDISHRTLAIRFGTYSSISYIGDSGYNDDRFNEYSYLRISDGFPSKMNVVGLTLSSDVFRKERPTPADKYDRDPGAALENHIATPNRQEAKNWSRPAIDICVATGRNIGRLITEIQRFNAIENVVVLGSVGNGIDDAAWTDMRTGILETIGKDGSDPPPPRLTFLSGASHRSSLLGAAMEHSERLAAAR